MKNRRQRLLLLSLLFLGTAATVPETVLFSATRADVATAPKKKSAPAPQKAVTIQKVTSVEGITEYRLSNGLKILLFPDASKPTITVNLTIFVGSRHEGYGEAGMAHLLEHMLFKGTPTHQNIPKALSARGARMNGTTWLDRTNYFEILPAQGDNLEFAIRLEADRMVNSLIRGKDLAKEMTVVRNEFERGENSPQAILEQRMMATAFEWHNYGQTTIGNRADIERVPVENLRKFYRRFYQTDNAMLVVSGKIDPKKTLQLIAKYFGAIPKPTRKLPNTYTEEPAQDGERFVTLRRVGNVATTGVLYHIPAGPHPDYVSISVLEKIMTASPSGRLYQSLVKTKRAADVSGAAYPLHDPGVLQFMNTVTKGNDPQTVLAAMLDSIDDVAQKGVTQKEVDRAKRALLKEWQLGAADSRKIAIELSEWAAQGDWRLYFLYRDRIEKVTAESVNKVAKKYLKRSNRTVGVFVPTKAPQRATIPTTPNVSKLLANYKGRKVENVGEAFAVTPENIDTQTIRKTLKSGAQIALLPKKNRGETVELKMTLRYGNLNNLKELVTAADFLGTMMSRGTKKLSRQELKDQLDQCKAVLSATGKVGTVNFGIKTTRKNLPAAMALLKQVVGEPSFSEKEFDVLKQQQITALEASRNEPQAIAGQFFGKQMAPYLKGDVRYVFTVDEKIAAIKALKIGDLKKLHSQYLGVNNAIVTAVGDFEPKAMSQFIEQTLPNWKSKKAFARIPLNMTKRPTGVVKDFITPGKANAMYLAGMSLPIRKDHPDYPALLIGNYILGGGSLSSRLADRVRQKDGLSYGIAARFTGSALDKKSVLYIYAISNPQNMPKVKIAIREEFERLLKNGVTAEELANAKKGYLQGQKIARSSDSTLLQLLQGNIAAKQTMKNHGDLEKQIENVTAAEVQKAMQKHCQWKYLHIGAAGDFKKKSMK